MKTRTKIAAVVLVLITAFLVFRAEADYTSSGSGQAVNGTVVVETNSFTFTQTNHISGQIYTNNNTVPILVMTTCRPVNAAIEFKVATQSGTQLYTNVCNGATNMLGGVVPPGYTFLYTNTLGTGTHILNGGTVFIY